MRARITVIDARGQSFEGEVELVPAVRRGGTPRTRSGSAAVADTGVDFGLPRRAFLKRYAHGSGPRKFALLVAHMTQGRTGGHVKHDAVEKEWNRNRGVLGGGFQTVYATRSKEKGWTDSAGRGTFVLRADWRGALTSRG